MRSARAVRSPPRRPKPSTSRSAVQFSGPGSWARGPEQPLTEGGLEKPYLDGLLVVVLANHSNAVITKQQSRSLQRGLRNRRKKQPAPLIEQHHRIAGFERGVLYLLFAFLELAAKVSRKMLANHRVAEHARIAVEIAFCRAFEDLALAPAIAVSDDIASVEGANVVTRRLRDDVVKGGVDQVVPLRRQRRLGPVVFDIVRSPKDLYVSLLPVATHDAQETEAVQSAERVRIRSLESLFLQPDGAGFCDALQHAPLQHVCSGSGRTTNDPESRSGRASPRGNTGRFRRRPGRPPL